MSMKACSHCKKEKPYLEFNNDASTKDGLTFWCKDCVRQSGIEYRANNKDKILRKKNNYVVEQRKCVRRWQIKNKEKVIAKAQKRRAKLKGNGGTYTAREWKRLLKRTGNKCLCCGVSGKGVTLTVDHVIPISKGGINDISNIQPLCGHCNSSKNNKAIDYR